MYCIKADLPWLGRITVALFGTLCIALVAQAQSEPSLVDQPAYFYDATGKRMIEWSASEFVVSLRDDTGRAITERPAQLPAAEPSTIPAAAELEGRMSTRGLHVVRGSTRAEVDQVAGAEFVLPVMYRPGSEMPMYPNNQVIVRFDDNVTFGDVQAIAATMEADVRPARGGQNRYILTVQDTNRTNPVAVANALHERQDTLYAEPDMYLPKVTYSPPVIEDPFYHSHQWHLDGDVSKGAAAGSDIDVEAAWDSNNGPTAQGSPTVRVAIIDECVEKLHEDLFPNYWDGLDVDQIPYDDDPSPDGGQRHGTACAGVAVAKGNNLGVRGAAPECGLIGIKFFGGSNADTAAAFFFTVDPDDDGDHSDGATILSNSWGFGDGTLLPADVVNSINFAANSGRNGKGCLVLFASANNDHTVNGVSALAQLPSVMAVGGTNSNGEHTEFSDVGPEVGIATPTNDRGDDGVRLTWIDITTVDNTGTSGYNGIAENNNYTNMFGGTSSATPLAAGVLGLIVSQDETMTAAQARAILQHTAVRIDEPYGRFDGITGHSHRLGFGRADAGAAVTAAASGLRWPDRIKSINVTGAGSNIQLVWSVPLADYAGSLLVRSSAPFAWMPDDGLTYTVGQMVAPGVEVIYSDAASVHSDVGAEEGGFFYAVYPYSATQMYGYGAKGHLIRNGITIFNDSLEGPDPGWTHGGAGDEWQRGTPTSANSIFGQVVSGSGPLSGLNGTRCINGSKCWATDLNSTYAPLADAYLDTPPINLTGVNVPVFLEYYDWCLMETFYDTFTVEAVDASGNFLGFIDADTGGDYDWTRRIYDITEFAGQAIKIRFHIQSDGLLQRDGWFLDEIKVIVAANVALPPLAQNVYVETTENMSVNAVLSGTDPNLGTQLDFVVTTLPAHGDLFDPEGGLIAAVPYTLLNNGHIVSYVPDLDYQGPDEFTYVTNDGGLDSNTAVVKLSTGTPVLAYVHTLSFDPGWLREGGWQYGVPQGIDGDPTSGATGPNVYGYNLSGEYPPSLPAERLTSLPFNCTGLSRVELRFARWLGIEDGSFDNASIEATNDGVTWTTVWRHLGGDLQETAWSQQVHNIADIADDQPFVQVRWTMGPTDSNTEFSGWNLDDIRITAIGSAQANQPPLAEQVSVATSRENSADITLAGSDANNDPLTFVIETLPPNGTLFDPNGGEITSVPYALLAGGNMVTYVPNGVFAGFDEFTYSLDDGNLGSNLATVSVQVIASAQFPHEDDFESGALSEFWFAESSSVGRIRVTGEAFPLGDFHVLLDSGADSTFARNELTLAVDLVGASNVLLEYKYKTFSEETHNLPASWTGSFNGDGVAISADGETWYSIAGFPNTGSYTTVLFDLDALAANVGIAYTDTFRIRFQQYDNFPIDSDGVALDDVRVLQGTQDPLITTTAIPNARVGDPYGPFNMAAAGGDHPLTWTTPVVFDEQDLAGSDFALVGLAQAFTGDSGAASVYQLPLPFAFPFYGSSYNTVRIGVDGFLDFAPFVGSTWNNSEILLSANVRVAVLWDDLRIDPGDDIYVDSSIPGEFTVRWDVTNKANVSPCSFSATLYDDGRIRLHYGAGNSGLTPTVGVSAGNQLDYLLGSYTGASNLGGANSLEFDYSKLPPGLSMSSDGVITGTATAAGEFEVLVVVEDDSERLDVKSFSVLSVLNQYGDYDIDGDTDLNDYVEFFTCMNLAVADEPCLEVFDDNADLIVDLRDFARFQREVQP